MKTHSKSSSLKDLQKNGLQLLSENHYVSEVVTLSNLFDIDMKDMVVGPPGRTQFKCPYCRRIKTPSLVMFVIHLTGWHHDKIPTDRKVLHRGDFKILGDWLAGKRKTLPKRFKRQEPRPPMISVV
jgi:hypothetical protein